ncbi:MAG: cell envelope integrity protein CreD [Breznakibacter sp.]
MEAYQSNKTNWASSLTFKMAVVAIMALLLLIPLGMINNIIREREETAREVENLVAGQWGDAQTVVGPILNIPVERTKTDKDGNSYIERDWLYVMPNVLDVQSQIKPEIRYKGIYKTAVYNSSVRLDGMFVMPFAPEEIDGQIQWNKAYVTIGISDNRGIRGDVKLNWNGQLLSCQAGTVSKEIVKSGFSAKTPLPSNGFSTEIPFSVQFDLSGSKSFSVLPLGQNSHIRLNSPWKDPNFIGSLLPQERTVGSEGFDASWNLTHLNRNFPQYWTNKQFDVWEHSLGVELFLPVNHYQKSLRSAKYGILFISLTLLVFVFIELTKNKKVHLFQYLLVGLALVLFFSVLTALSEHIGFNWAYGVASVVNMAMIGIFAHGLLKDKTLTGWVVALLLVMYGFMFVLLQLNDYAFLAGNVGLVIALAFVMKASLKLRQNNWNE